MPISHANIERYHIDGTIGDEAYIPRLKDQYIRVLETLMERDGFVKRYDIDPDFTVSYNNEQFDFELSLYGV